MSVTYKNISVCNKSCWNGNAIVSKQLSALEFSDSCSCMDLTGWFM